MKFVVVAIASLMASPAVAFIPAMPKSMVVPGSSSSTLNMVLEKPAAKKISKLETLKVNSKNLVHPRKEVSYLH
jgi:hypothetical protein